MKFDEEIAVAVLVQHQRIGMGDCSCGPIKLGTSYPRHQVTEIIKAHREAGK